MGKLSASRGDHRVVQNGAGSSANVRSMYSALDLQGLCTQPNSRIVMTQKLTEKYDAETVIIISSMSIKFYTFYTTCTCKCESHVSTLKKTVTIVLLLKIPKQIK